ncbi:C40 family peptidase [Bacillus marinisedimentorum]|uniref:C40 family peptidase n=1 Tax=Bacillus marinisedimentorum TaxID=1821260 RepID=UPI003CCBD346
MKIEDKKRSAQFGVAKAARRYIGTPYRWGGTTPAGFDCSGFLKHVFAKQGVNIPRTVSDIWNFGTDVTKPSVGDILFFQTYKPGPSHAGIYLGDGKFIHAGSSKGVTVSKLDTSYWKSRYLGTKRMIQHN